jgi:CheY-like chemotaxis protein
LALIIRNKNEKRHFWKQKMVPAVHKSAGVNEQNEQRRGSSLSRPRVSRKIGMQRMAVTALRVLVIEDEPATLKLLCIGLRAQRYQTFEAANGKEALNLLCKDPDLIILDLGLPDVEGHELLRTIRVHNEQVPIVILSGRGDEAGKVKAFDFGADDYITKPFSMNELLARMRTALRHRLRSREERPLFRTGELGRSCSTDRQS